MKEWRIKDKVTSILERMGNKQQAKRLESNRVAARVANLVSQEIDSALKQYSLNDIAGFKRHICVYVHDVIKAEMR